MKSPSLLWSTALLLIALSLTFIFACGLDKQNSSNADATEEKSGAEADYTAITAGPCECQRNWFPHSQTPPPKENVGSPFDAPSTTNCIFHQWSWQKFLWLTKPVGGQPNFLNGRDIFQVDAYMNRVNPPSQSELKLEYTTQAGSNGIVKSNANYSINGSSLPIYYALYANDVMFQAAEKYVRQLNSKELPATNTQSFPVNSLEIKTAWVNTAAFPIEELDYYYIQQASVKNANGVYEPQSMALVGMHIVGIVINHPEFIWATFEHQDLAPYFDWNTGLVESPDKLMYAAGQTNTLGGIQWDSTTTSPNIPFKAYSLFDKGVPRVPGNGFMETSQKEPENIDNINTINRCVASNLQDVFRKYFYKGAIWINTDGLNHQQQVELINNLGQKIADIAPGSYARGCTSLANLTMETFDQTFAPSIQAINIGNNANCFSCHNAVSFTDGMPTSPIYLSHLFDAYYSKNHKKNSTKEVVRLKRKQYLELRDLVGAK